MPIGFARCVFVQRSRGHSILAAAAYIGRAKLRPPYPAVDYSSRGDLLVPMTTMLPRVAPPQLKNTFALWHAMELASPRKDSTLGLHLMLALPAPGEMAASYCLPLLEEFVTDLILPHGLAASFAVHEPHLLVQEDEPMHWIEINSPPKAPSQINLSNRNRHAHVLISPRRVGPSGIEARRYTALEPAQVSVNNEIRGVSVAGIDWPALWARHQNSFFARWGLGLRVRPWAEYVDYHHGSRRDRQSSATSTTTASITTHVVERANRATVSDPARLLKLVGRRPFTEQDLHAMVERYVGLGHPHAETIANTAITLPNVVRLEDELGGTGSPWLATHDLARVEQKCMVLAAALMDKGQSSVSTGPGPSQTNSWPSASYLTIEYTEPHKQLPDLPPSHDGRMNLVLIDSGRGVPKNAGRVLTPHNMAEKLPARSLVIVDHADTLTARQLHLVLLAAFLAPECRLILSRRSHSHLDPRNPLLDIITATTGLRPHALGLDALRHAKSPLRRTISRLEASSRIVFTERDQLVAEAASRLRGGAGPAGSIFCPDYEFSAWLRMNRLPASDKGAPDNAVVIHMQPSFGNLTALPRLAQNDDLVLLVDRSYCPDLATLYAQADISSSAPCAIALPPHAAEQKTTPGWPAAPSIRWTVDRAGRVGTKAEHIAASLAHTYADLLVDDLAGHDLVPGLRLNLLFRPDLADEIDRLEEEPDYPSDTPPGGAGDDLAQNDDDPGPDDQPGPDDDTGHDWDDAAEIGTPDDPDPIGQDYFDPDHEPD